MLEPAGIIGLAPGVSLLPDCRPIPGGSTFARYCEHCLRKHHEKRLAAGRNASQPNKIHYFFPHTFEGESFRVEIVSTPLERSLRNDHRPNKTLDKSGTSGVFRALFATTISHIPGSDQKVLELDEKTSAMIVIVEKNAKQAALNYTRRAPQGAAADPFVCYLNGKLDGKIVTNVALSWLERQALLKWTNPAYEIEWVTTAMDGRIGIRRTLFQAAERRGVVNHVVQNLFRNKRMWNAAFAEQGRDICILLVYRMAGFPFRVAAFRTATERKNNSLSQQLLRMRLSKKALPAHGLYQIADKRPA